MLVVSVSRMNWLVSDGIDRAQRRLQHDQPEDLRLVQPEREPGLDLALVDRLHAAADDLDRVGAAVDAERDDRGRRRVSCRPSSGRAK